MKKITFIFALILASISQSYGQFNEGFETGIPATWTVLNGGDTNTWGANTFQPHAASTGQVSIVYTTPTAHDDHLVTPAIVVTNNVTDRISFWARSRDPLYPEVFDVKLSTTTPTAAAFTTTIATGVAPLGSALQIYYQYTYDLSAYEGQTVYISIYSSTADMFILDIDDFVNDGNPATVPSCAANPVSTPDAACGNFASTISWDASPLATSYILTVGTTSGGTDVLNNINIGNVLTYAFPTQSINTTYYWKVVPTNVVGPAVGCTENSYTTNTAGCYCISDPTSNDGLGITNVLLGTTNVPNGDVTYADYTATSVTFPQGLNSNCQITFATGYTYNTYIWIDFNNNFAFEPSELVFTGVSLATNPTTYNASFIMPATAALGSHRMRIVTADDVQTPPNPCYSGVYAVTLDFTVNIVAPSCTPPAATAVIAPACATNQYNVAVNVTALGSGTPAVSDGTTSWPVTAVGIVNVGPFANGANVTLTLLHGSDSTCNVPLGSYTYSCPPANDNCTGAIALTAGFDFAANPVTGSVLAATTDATGPTCAFNNSFNSGVWYSVVVPASGSLTIETQAAPTNTLTDTTVAAFSGTCATLTQVGCDDDTGLGNMSLFSMTGLTAGDTLYIGVWKWGAEIPTATVNQFRLSAYDPSLANDTFTGENFMAYPNPVKDVLNLSYSQNIEKVQVLNLLGQEVLTKSINASQSQIDMSNLAQGTYLVKVTSEDQVKTIKVIKE